MSRKRAFFYVYLCFFFSGLTSLLYETIWTRMLSLIFGHTVLAISTVLAVFMGGLALGSYLMGRWVDIRERRPLEWLWRRLGRDGSSVPLRLYGILEGIIGFYVLLTPALTGAIEKMYVLIAARGGFSYQSLNLACFFMSFLALIIPTTCMGATLPVLSKFLIQTREEVGGKLGGIYALNTAGAVTGSALAGFVLLSVFGLKTSLLAGAVINIWIMFMVFYVERVLSAGEGAGEDAPGGTPVPGDEECADSLPPWMCGWVIFSFGIVGFSSMVYEVAWTRAICLAIGSSIYAFSIILTTFLIGIALGSAVFSLFFSRRGNSVLLLAWVEAAVGAASLGLTFFFGNLPYYFYRIFPLIQGSHFTLVLGDFMLCLAAMIVPTALMGFAFPLAARLYIPRFSLLGRGIGDVYSANTLGCIIGSFLAGFVLIPLLGVLGTMKAGILANLAVALCLFMCASPALSPRRRTFPAALSRAALCLLLAGATLAIPGWDKGLMSSGPAIYAGSWGRMQREEFINRIALKPVYYRDGLSSTVTVHEAISSVQDPLLDYPTWKNLISLRVNGKADASNFNADMQTQILLGFLPTMLHPSPRRIAVIGLGSGITLDAVRQAPEVKVVDCAELEPAVVEAADYFSRENHNVLSDGRVRLFTTDGRLLLLASPERYDVIVSEPSNPWIAGITNLFSVEFYRICEERLASGGLVCQWLHLYNMEPSNIKMVLKTFYSIFPHGSLWLGGDWGDLILIGQKEDRPLDPRRLELLCGRNGPVGRSLGNLGFLSPGSILTSYLMDADTAGKISALAPLNTDDLPLLEFSAPRSMYQSTTSSNLEGLRRFRGMPKLPENDEARLITGARARLYRGIACLSAGQNGEALKEFEAALLLEPSLVEARRQVGRILMSMGKEAEAGLNLRRAFREKPGDYRTAYSLGLLCMKRERWDEAVSFLSRSLALGAGEGAAYRYAALLGLGRSLSKIGRAAEAEGAFRNASLAQKKNVEALLELALLCYRGNRLDAARRYFERALSENPGNFQALQGLGDIRIKEDRYPEAAVMFRRALAAEPRSISSRINLAFCLIKTGRPGEAMKLYRQVLAEDPYNVQVIEFLKLMLK
jgi:spermidine synthase